MKNSADYGLYASDADNELRLLHLYGLTRAEARVAVLMASGLPLPAVANLLGVSQTTARTHLQRIYGKTDTHSQVQLVALLLVGPAQLNIEYCAPANP